MTKNLQIFLLQEKIKNLLTQSNLDISIVYLILKNILVEIEDLYNKQIDIDYSQYLKENQKQEVEVESSEPQTMNIEVIGQE